MKQALKMLGIIVSIWILSVCTIASAENVDKTEIEEITLDKMANPEGNIYVTTDEKYADLGEYLRKTVTSKSFPGSVLVATDEQIIYASGTNILEKNGETVSPYTTYQIGSISKSFTATCILKLIEEGKLHLDDRMELFFPECDSIKEVTIHQLLQMNAGISDIVNFPDTSFGDRSDEFLKEMMAETIDSEKLKDYMKDIQFTSEPGTAVEYSNTNYLLLALIIEKVTGQTFKEYLHQTILNPLGMENTESGAIENITCDFAAPDPQITFVNNPALTKGTGDMTSNVLDLYQYDKALFTGSLLSQESMDTLFDFLEGYSCGWMKDVRTSPLHMYGNGWKTSDENTIFHGGRIPRFLGYNIINKFGEERVYVILLFNNNEETTASFRSILSRIGAVLGAVKTGWMY